MCVVYMRVCPRAIELMRGDADAMRGESPIFHCHCHVMPARDIARSPASL